VKQKLLNLISFVISFFPTQLPRTPAAFEKLMRVVTGVYGLPDSVNCRFAISTAIMHLKPTEDRKATRFFVKAIRKLQANEVAYDVMEAARKAQQPPAAPTAAVVPDATIQG